MGTKKCHDESETVNWITVHTKPCPKCHKPVEKNAERAKRDLYRYMHYHNRYKAHTDSFKLESNLKETIREKVSNLEKKDSRIRDSSWVTNGLYRLFRSRRVLSYSYPFAFYMFGDDLFKDEMTNAEREIKQNLFEDQQQQLEANVEKLSKFVEEPFDQFAEDKVMQIRMQVINLSVITDNLCKKMYDCIENELLGSLQFGIHNIAPYQSKGIEKATELSVCRNPKDENTEKCPTPDYSPNGIVTEPGRPSGSGSSYEGGCSSRNKRPRTGSLGSCTIDLNLPADVID